LRIHVTIIYGRAAAQDIWAASLPCYAMDESAHDAEQQPTHQTQLDHRHSDDDSLSSGKDEWSDQAEPADAANTAESAPASTLFSADFRRRSCSPREPLPTTVVWAVDSDGHCRGQANVQVAASRHAHAQLQEQSPDTRGTGLDKEPGRGRQPDAPLGSHSLTANYPSAPDAVAPLRASEQTRRDSVGYWIDAALADEGWWDGERDRGEILGRLPDL
jgi:hypothetical protein